MKKKFRSFFAIFLSVLAVVLSGCSLDLDDDSTSSDLDGVKVLSKSEDYDFSAALGDYSTNFFNLFSKNVLELLYQVYELPTTVSADAQEFLYASTTTLLDGTTSTLSSSSTFTFDDYYTTKSDEIYYLFDSMRITLKSETPDGTTSSDVVFSTANSWNWAIPYNSTGGTNFATVFENSNHTLSGSGDITVTVGANNLTYYTYIAFMNDASMQLFWPAFGSVYFSTSATYNSEGNVDYYHSPFYSSSASQKNYYQDLLEYVCYLTVLGCTPTDDADYFDFTISKDASGIVSGVTVGGWGSSKISLSGDDGALAQVKAVYESIGEYVGLTDTDRAQIAQFILDTVIGSSALNQDTFSVSIDGTATSFSRNYTQMVKRIVDYACMLVPIGEDSSGEVVSLEESFPVAEITDYNGDYFMSNEDSVSGNGTFDYIDAQQFQSLVIMPNSETVADGNPLGMVGLSFEYGGDGGSGYADSLTVNVGVRHYNSQTGVLTDYGTSPVVIQKGACETLNSDDYTFMISSDEDYSLVLIDDITLNTDVNLNTGKLRGCFNTSIGSDAINAISNPNSTEKTGTDGNVKKLTITAGSEAKNYYKTTRSTLGTAVTLNEEKFSGSDGCDFFEIYFVVEKSGETLTEMASTNYNFKVVFWAFMFNSFI